MWISAERGNTEEVRSLLKNGADPNHDLYFKDDSDWTESWKTKKDWWRVKLTSSHTDWWKTPRAPLHRACMNGNLQIVKALVEGGAKVNKLDGVFRLTPLHYACEGGHKQVVIYLTKKAKCKIGK